MDPLAIALALAAFAGPFVTYWIFSRNRADVKTEKRAKTTLEEATLAIATWKELTREFESQMRTVQTRLDQCTASEAELRTNLATLELKVMRLNHGQDTS